jgi:capsular exopolysaccharide synthesis family protein
MPEFTGHRDIRAYLRTIWRWKLLIVVLVAGAPAAAYLLERNKPPIYSSTVTLDVNSQANSGLPSSSGNSVFATGNLSAIAQIVTTSPLANIAGTLMRPPESGAQAVSGVSATDDVTTGFLTITATKASPTNAAATATAFADALNVAQSNQSKQALREQIKTTRAQLAGVNHTSSNYGTLQAQLAQYRTELAHPSDIATIVNPATPNYTPVGPHLRRSVELGLVIGILIACAAVMLLDSADRRLRTPDELEEFTGLPLLAAIPPSAFATELDTKPVDAESFHTLRTSLTYFTIDKRVKSVLVTSPGEQEGKSTVAVRLALASANAGMDVVLVDADLRRGGATEKLGIVANVGLGLLLAEQRPLASALIQWPLEAGDGGRLRVLAAGPPPPNPAALISSQQMRDLIQQLEDEADLVVIDTPAALAVSDAVPLMQSVSGVVLVARMNRSSRDTIRRLQKIIIAAHGTLLGTVATGVTAGPGYQKYSASYYGPRTKKRRWRGKRQQLVVTPMPYGTENGAAAPLKLGASSKSDSVT